MNRTYFEESIPRTTTKARHQTINIDYSEVQSRKHSRSLMSRDERSHTLMSSGFEDRRYSVYKTPTNAKRKSKQINTNGSSHGKSNYR
jgi:hypothetical protein